MSKLPNCYRCGCQPCECQDGITLYHGDCMSVLKVMPTLTRDSVSVVVTDPPYGKNLTNHDPGGRRRVGSYFVAGDHDQSIGHEVIGWCRPALPMVVFASPMYPWNCGGWRQWLVWDKGPAVGGGGDVKTLWKMSWELIQVCGTQLRGTRDEAVLHFHVTPRDSQRHPCEKPLSLVRYLIEKTTDLGQTVLDPFVGSGTTLRAAKDLGRKAIGIEINEKYCRVAAERLRQEVLFTNP